jgi:hypothetical protein
MRRTVAAAVVAVALLAAACANEPGGTGQGGITHPTGSDRVVLRVSYEGGFVPVEYVLTQFPTFSLFGDGLIVVPGAQIEIYPGPALPAASERTVTEEGMQAILQAALDAGLGDGDRELTDMGSVGIADASTTVFTLTANGTTSTVKVYALGALDEQPAGMDDEEFALRQRLEDLVERLGVLDQWLPEGSIGDETTFDPAGYRLFVGDYRPDESVPQTPATWPLSTPLASFGEPTAALPDVRCGAVSGGDWDSLEPAASQSNQLTPWVSGDTEYGIRFRPLLPDESGC